MKFIRRKDLDTETRLNIIKAGFSCMGTYGSMTNLALKYNISRTFLYQLMAASLIYLSEMFRVESRNISNYQMDIEPFIILLRLEGKCSISSISEILKVLNYNKNSTGMISELLTKYGKILPDTLSSSEENHIVYLSDEIFALDCPILITIEPRSTAILKIELAPDRSSKSWQNHYKELKLNQFIAKALASDRGKGITSGIDVVYPQLPWYSDHFHEFRGLFRLLSRLKFLRAKTLTSKTNLKKKLMRLFSTNTTVCANFIMHGQSLI
ncbi:hypothetical protein [Candidatus Parabeggiatoa sp. HSG14]|uniref:hypothetical protein n=1 Tax=Candidatus Parabeggiatoa sp. HSG14 TaxID=3055593 RepID=UPI0025A70253|nr:hypothetical protein [Thiotrichales bacterium HSG14]